MPLSNNQGSLTSNLLEESIIKKKQKTTKNNGYVFNDTILSQQNYFSALIGTGVHNIPSLSKQTIMPIENKNETKRKRYDDSNWKEEKCFDNKNIEKVKELKNAKKIISPFAPEATVPLPFQLKSFGFVYIKFLYQL